MDRQIEKKRWTKKRIIIILISFIFLIFLIYIIFFIDASNKLNIEKTRLVISTVKRAPFQESIIVTGTIEPIKTVYLDLPVGGIVIQKYVEEGAFLNANDSIIKLDNPNLTLQLMNTQSSFMLAESQLSQTRLTFEQNRLYKEKELLDLNMQLLEQKRKYEEEKSLFERGLNSKNAYESSKDKYEYLVKSRELMVELLKKDSLTNVKLIEQSEENVERLKNYLKLVERQLSNLTVKAPIKGQLTSLKAEIGQSVSSGYRLGQIDNTDSFKIRAEVPEYYVSKVYEGLAAECEFNGKNYKLTIKTVYPQITNGIFYIDLVFYGKQPEIIRRGQTVRAKLFLGDLTEALLIERGGFYSTTGGQWIFVVDKSETYAEKREIKIGRQNPQYYEVLDGLNPGEKVIISSYENFGDAEKLILK